MVLNCFIDITLLVHKIVSVKYQMYSVLLKRSIEPFFTLANTS